MRYIRRDDRSGSSVGIRPGLPAGVSADAKIHAELPVTELSEHVCAACRSTVYGEKYFLKDSGGVFRKCSDGPCNGVVYCIDCAVSTNVVLKEAQKI